MNENKNLNELIPEIFILSNEFNRRFQDFDILCKTCELYLMFDNAKLQHKIQNFKLN